MAVIEFQNLCSHSQKPVESKLLCLSHVECTRKVSARHSRHDYDFIHSQLSGTVTAGIQFRRHGIASLWSPDCLSCPWNISELKNGLLGWTWNREQHSTV